MNKGSGDAGPKSDDDSDDDIGYDKFGKKMTKEQRAARQRELDALKASGKDTVEKGDAIRLPNRVAKGMNIDPRTGTATMGNDRDVIMSPTSFLQGAASPRLNSFMAGGDENTVQYEGEMIRKATETKLKKYWYCLLGKELYVYKNKSEEKHKGMHNLVGVFLKEEEKENLDATTVLYPFSLIFPGNKPRTYYLLNKDDRDKWINAIKKVIGYSCLHDFYDFKETLGKGKFGLVKSAIHKKTGKKVAVKIMSKKEMTVQDVELQRREIEIMKMCQHPYIIRLLDIFENQDYIYIIMENLKGGDLFTYLEKRDFEISEERAKVLSH